MISSNEDDFDYEFEVLPATDWDTDDANDDAELDAEFDYIAEFDEDSEFDEDAEFDYDAQFDEDSEFDYIANDDADYDFGYEQYENDPLETYYGNNRPVVYKESSLPDKSSYNLTYKFSNAVYSIHSKIRGITVGDRQRLVEYLKTGQELRLVREPKNNYDRNAIAIYCEQGQLGYIPKELSVKLAPQIDKGQFIRCTVANITGAAYANSGVNILLEGEHLDTTSTDLAKNRLQNRDRMRDFFFGCVIFIGLGIVMYFLVKLASL